MRLAGQINPVIVPGKRRQFELHHPDEHGVYDDGQSSVLDKGSPWDRIARKVFAHGGELLEYVDDGEFAERLLSHGTYRPTHDIGWVDQGDPLGCLSNVDRMADRRPHTQISIGLGCHYPDGYGGGFMWCRHTWLTAPRLLAPLGGAIWEVTQIPPGGYFGFAIPSGDWWLKWASIAGESLRG